MTAFLVLQIPAVQESLIHRYLRAFSGSTRFKTTIESFQLLWFDRLELTGVTILDPEENKMITAKTITLNFKLSNLVQQRDINIDGIALEGANVLVTKIKQTDSTTNLNINVFVDNINEVYGRGKGTAKTPKINIGEAVVTESLFSYIDQEKDSIKQGFNYNQFAFNIDEAQLHSFMILGDTTEFNLNTLIGHDHATKFPVKEFSTFFRLCQQSMEFVGLQLSAGDSFIADTVVFKFNGYRDLSNFVPRVSVHANLANTILHPRDLALFAPGAERLTKPLLVSGEFNGRINNFRLTDMEIGTGQTLLRGSLDMDGLPDITETFIILKLKDSKLDINDISFLFKDQTLQRLRPIGRVKMDGEFVGYPTDFVAKGEFEGSLGKISSDINFKVNEKNFDQSEYSGTLSLAKFNLGAYLKDTTNFQFVNLTGKVKGSGLTIAAADFNLNGRISSIGLRKYNYKNITTNARFASQLFNGLIKINDPNLKFSAQGSVDLREGMNTIRMQAVLDTALLHNLKLTSQEIFLRSRFNIDLKGLHIDSVAGKGDLYDAQIVYNNKSLNFKEIHLDAHREQNERQLRVRTNLADAEVKGNFLLSDITRDISTLVKEIRLNITNDESEIRWYYAEKNYRPKSYQANFKINLKEVDPIIKLFRDDITMSQNSVVEGQFTSGYTSILKAYTKIDTIFQQQKMFIGTELELNTSKIADSTSVLAVASVNSQKQIFSSKFQTRDLFAEAIWNKNHIDFTFEGDQHEINNYVRLYGAVDFLQDSTHLKFLPSSIKVLDKVWDFDPDNLITIQKKDIHIQNLTMRHKNQFVALDGAIADDPSKIISLDINDLDLSMLNAVTGRNIKGTMNAKVDVSNIYDNPYVQNDLHVDSLTVDNFLIGNITGKNHWDTLQRKFEVSFFINRNDVKIIDVDGNYHPSNKTSPLNVKASLKNANLKILEPFLEDIFSNIGGTATGDFNITGQLTEPQINGEGYIGDGEIMVNYLKADYDFKGSVGLTPNAINFNNLEITDIYGNNGRLNGSIRHNNFYSMRVNIDASFNNLQVLNTSARDNSLFYGQGYATGDLNIFGPVDNLKLTANARTERNTNIKIPISGTSEVERKEFIKFVNFTDSAFQKSLVEEINERVELKGITMDFNLDVTPDAYCEIIFDLKAGDIIRGRGNGELQLQYDSKGEFTMFGPFEFTEGWYNFTLYDVFNKEFEVKRGSRINWYGDPYQGILDISASYNQNASFAPIIDTDEIASDPAVRRNYPIQVLLELDGPMLSPNIDFDIVANDLPSVVVNGQSLDFIFQTFKNRMDEQELRRQVFSLIVLQRFSPLESFNTSGSIANSVSELLSNQLSNWISQVDENLVVDIDLSTFDQEAFNTFQFRFSYTLLNGRLRITRDGTTFYGNQDASGAADLYNSSFASIAGDWTVDYLLTGDGKFRVKMYNRSNFNPTLNTLGLQNSVTTGASITHTQTFNQIKDLWKAARARRKEENEENVTGGNQEAIKSEETGTE